FTNDCLKLRVVTLKVNEFTMDLGIIAAIIMLAIWAFVTFTTTAPGWIHILLTLGMFLLIYRIVVRGTRGVDRGRKG
ncbi:MAG TPA: DUF5670 family protein, partial [Gemmatimonadaceae bacterium]|nr:DUF5670 family protein [Gemmatimonadaceae bacterium]